MAPRPHPTARHRLFAALLLGTALCALAVSPLATTANGDTGVTYVDILWTTFCVLPGPPADQGCEAPDVVTPSVITIPVGTWVQWTHRDGSANCPCGHKLTSDDGKWESPNLAYSYAYTKQFTEPGTYTYHDGYHPELVGTIIVTGDVVVFR